MADNTTLPATGTGTADIVVATDKVGGVDYQRVKLVWGADGTVNDADTASGKGVPVQAGDNLNTSALALESGGNLAASATSLAAIDDWDESDRAKVNLIVGQAGVQGGSGAVSATTQRVVLATDVALPSGTNAIGKLAANSGVDIGDVDVTSLPALPTGANTIGSVKLTDGTDVADVLDLTNSNPVAVAIVDGSGDQITSFGGGTQYTEDAVAPGDPVGTALVVTRDDQLSTVTEAEGDWSRARGTSKGALWVAIADSSGDPITSFGGGTQYTEDAAAAANPVGSALNLVRDDARVGSLTNTDGDNVAARGTNAGELYVKHVDTIAVTQSGTWDEVGINDSGNSITVDNAVLSVVGGGTEATAQRVTIATDSTGVLSVDDNGGSLTVDGTVAVTGVATAANQSTQITAEQAIQTSVELIDDAIKADDAAFTPATTKVMMAGFEFDDSSPDSVDEGDAGAARMSSRREVYVQLRDAAGNERGLNVSAVGGIGVTGPLTDTELRASDVKITLDSEAVVLGAGSAAIGKLAANSGVDIGDVTLTANSGIDIGDVDVTSIVPGTGATNLGKAEDGGHTTGDVGVFVLGVRNDSVNATLGADADYIQFSTNKIGAIRVAPIEDDFAVLGSKHVKKYYTNAGAVTDGIVWSPAANTRWYITSIFINVSAAATVTLEDDLAGGDSAIWKAELAANSGWSSSFPVPWFSGEDAADLIITTSAGNVYVTVVGYEV